AADMEALERSLEQAAAGALIRAWTTSDAMRPLFAKIEEQAMDLAVLVAEGERLTEEHLGPLRASIAGVVERSEAFAEILEELGLVAKETAESFGGLRNVPSGFKYTLQRFRAADPIDATPAVVPMAVPQEEAPSQAQDGGAPIIVDMRGAVIYGVDDLERRIETAVSKAQRKKHLADYGLSR